MDSMKRHIPPLTPFMEFSDAIFLLSLYRRGETVESFVESCHD
jgi:hypothetical protein